MLSVIVPVYQAVGTLEKCISSILAQNVDEMEIILVDDGATDGSGELCDLLSEKYPNIFVKHIDNGGPYQARRKGVLCAKGDFVTFVDADDCLEKHAYNHLFGIYEKYCPDIILFAYRMGENGKEILHEYQDGLYTKKRIEKEILPSMIWDIKLGRRRIDPSVCCKLMKKSLFFEVTQDVDERIVWGEDAAITYPMICLSKSIYICNKAYYNYCVTNNSCTRNYGVERIDELKNFKKVLRKKISMYSNVDMNIQIDCYVRDFLDMLSVNWFDCHLKSQRYLFPFARVEKGSKIKLYGAGEVGKSFYQNIIQTGYAEFNGWYDKNAENIKEFLGEKIYEAYDIKVENDETVIIAVSNENVATDIRAELVSKGIPNDQIVWEKPVMIS